MKDKPIMLYVSSTSPIADVAIVIDKIKYITRTKREKDFGTSVVRRKIILRTGEHYIQFKLIGDSLVFWKE